LESLVDKRVRKQILSALPPVLAEVGNNKDEVELRLLKAMPCYLHRLEREKKEKEGEEKEGEKKEGEEKGEGNPSTSSNAPQKSLSQEADEYCKNEKVPSPEDVVLLETISRMSLNRILIVVDGVMTVETTALSPKIVSIKFDDATNWTDIASQKKGTITGAYLTGGVPKIQNEAALGITDVTAVAEGSDDQNLHFSLKITRKVEDQTQLTFVVEKKAKDGSLITSTPFPYKVESAAPAARIDKVVFDNPPNWTDITTAKTGTIVGSNLSGGVPKIQNEDALGITITGVTQGSDDKNLHFSIALKKEVKESELQFLVETKAKDGSTVNSAPSGPPFEYKGQSAPIPPNKPATPELREETNTLRGEKTLTACRRSSHRQISGLAL
jgi:hypothetical protein